MNPPPVVPRNRAVRPPAPEGLGLSQKVPLSQPPLVRRSDIGKPQASRQSFPTEPPKVVRRPPPLPPFEEPSSELDRGFFELDESLDLPETPINSFHPPSASSPMERYELKVTHDPFFSSSLVIGLDTNNFPKFLTNKDAVAVMFYDSTLPQSRELEKVVSEASHSTKRAGHAYASVDCNANSELCMEHNAYDLPMVRVYAKTFCLGTMKKNVSPDALRQRVENAPPGDAFRMVECSPCFKGQ